METMVMEMEKQTEATKRCPFCAEEILQAAIKCRFCGEFLNKSHSPQTHDSKVRTKWYSSTSTVVMGLLCLGPLALPLVWLNPRYKVVTKIVVTIVVGLVTLLACYLTTGIYLRFIKEIEAMGIH